MDTNTVKMKFLTVYDYGTGGIWNFVAARSKDEIKKKFPMLRVYALPPDWMSQAELKDIEAEGIYDIDTEPTEFFAALLMGKYEQ